MLVPEVFTKSIFIVANAVTAEVARYGLSFLINGFCALPTRLRCTEEDLTGAPR